MESNPNSSSIMGQSLTTLRSEKVFGGKRNIDESGDKEEHVRKRVKMRDLESVLRSEVIGTHCSQKDKLSSDELHSGEEMSQVTNVPVTSDLEASKVERSGRGTFPVVVVPLPRLLDLNTEVSLAKNSVRDVNLKFAKESDQLNLLTKHESENDIRSIASGGVGLDLNAEDVSSSEYQETSYGDSKNNQLKSVDVPECRSTTGSQEEKGSLRIWEEMKQNGFLSSSHGGLVAQSGFLSSSHGGIPVPKQRGRKSKTDMAKKRLELAKKEQIDRFAKIAAPSGLLNELNPGIINHVRNRKQVHSIIEALVRSEKLENGHAGGKQSYVVTGIKEYSNRKDKETVNDSGIHGTRFSTGDGKLATSSVGQRTIGQLTSSGDGNSSMVGRALDRNFIPNSNTARGDDMLALKLSTSMKASEDVSSMFNDESSNITSVSSLSVKAATVASQWLELMHQDLKGRLSALRRSKKRVQAVITTELPLLLSKEFSSNQENGPFALKSAADGLSSAAISAMHRARWNTLFDQMDKTLSEEEIQLGSWLNQVKEMQLLCEQGLQHMHWNIGFDSQPPGTSESDSGSMKVDCSGRELAVRAAAASIYSTCNFLMSRENLPCF